MLRKLPEALHTALRAHAEATGLGMQAAVVQLLEQALASAASTSRGGHVRAANLTASQRTAFARRAAQARWGAAKP
jgi:plasmid stability protein